MAEKDLKQEESVNNPLSTDGSDQKRAMQVPPWCIPAIRTPEDVSALRGEMKEFYKIFKRKVLKGEYPDLQGNTNYALTLVYDLIGQYRKHKDFIYLQQTVERLEEHYPGINYYHFINLVDEIGEQEREEYNNQLGKIHRKASKKELKQRCKWVSPGQQVDVQGYTLKKGLFYLGEKFLIPEVRREKLLPQLQYAYLYAPVIDPSLEVRKGEEEWLLFRSYKGMTPTMRDEYLRWLAGEYPDTDLYPGFMEIYLHGIEVRLMIDVSSSKEERRAILIHLIEWRKELDEYHQSLLDRCIDRAVMCHFRKVAHEFVPSGLIRHLKHYSSYLYSTYIQKEKRMDFTSAYNLAKDWLYDKADQIPEEYEVFAFQVFSREFHKKYGEYMHVPYTYSEYYFYLLGGQEEYPILYGYFPELDVTSRGFSCVKFKDTDFVDRIYDCYQKAVDAFTALSSALKRNEMRINNETLMALAGITPRE